MASIIIPGRSIPKRPTFELPRLNRDSPQAQGLVGWWPLSFDGRDFGGAGFNGTANGDPSVINGTLGRATNFDGNDFYDSGLLNGYFADMGDGVSLGGWLRTTMTTNGYMFGGSDDLGGIDARLDARINLNSSDVNDSGKVAVFMSDGSTTRRIKGATTNDTTPLVNDGEWHFVWWVYDPPNGTANVYVDGVDQPITFADNDVFSGALTANAEAPYIGAFHFSTSGAINHLNGDMMDFRIQKGVHHNVALLGFDPATRWDLYAQEERKIFVDIGAAPAPAAINEHIIETQRALLS